MEITTQMVWMHPLFFTVLGSWVYQKQADLIKHLKINVFIHKQIYCTLFTIMSCIVVLLSYLTAIKAINFWLVHFYITMFLKYDYDFHSKYTVL